MKNYLIIIEKTKKNFCAYSPDVLGVVATGKTEGETKKNFMEALEFHLHGLKEDHIKEPENITNFAYTCESNSGVINIRCRKSLHQKLKAISEKENVSISHLVNDALVKMYG